MTDILGRPITGDVQERRTMAPVTQLGPEEFIAQFDKFFAKYPDVQFLRWGQGTPSFNDGDPCEFFAGELRLGLQELPEDEDVEEDTEYGDGTITYYEMYDLDRTDNHNYTKTFTRSHNGFAFTEEFINDFNKVTLEGGEFYELLQDNFGDPAEVTATREGFSVDYYEIGY